MRNKSEALRCYCNDKNICPDTDFCDTTTVCMTKHVKYINNEKSEYKYFCGDYGNSFRNDIIQFRDCYIKTNIKSDYEFLVKNSNEYCCDDADFCNKDLKPIEAFYDLNESPTIPNHTKNSEVFNFSNIVLLSTASAVLLIFIIIAFGLVILTRRNKKLRSNLGKENDMNSRSENCPFIDAKSNDGVKKRIFCFYIPTRIYKPVKTISDDEKDQTSENASDEQFIIGPKVVDLIQPSCGEHTHTLPASTITTTISTGTGSSSSQCITISTGELHSSCNPELTFSGSGKLGPVVVNRTIARDIKRIECIGKGRYGSVWKAKWSDDLVAVKVFSSNELKSWENEINIYLTQCLRDDNILGFIAADLIDQEFYSELWIITDYHKNGALYDYLNLKTITPSEMIKMAFSITKGLFHLHRAIIGCKGKVPLAHCDLKTKNILIKNDLSCCIGDLGLAMCGDYEGHLQAGTDLRIGTKRYMAPEILDRSIDTHSIHAYQKADMYSLSLVFWELLRRCEYFDRNTNTTIKFDFQLPYYEHADMNPDENQMRNIVCDKKLRPEMLAVWENSELEIIKTFTILIKELWHEDPEGRLKVLSVKKLLEKLKDEIINNASAPTNEQIV